MGKYGALVLRMYLYTMLQFAITLGQGQQQGQSSVAPEPQLSSTISVSQTTLSLKLNHDSDTVTQPTPPSSSTSTYSPASQLTHPSTTIATYTLPPQSISLSLTTLTPTTTLTPHSTTLPQTTPTTSKTTTATTSKTTTTSPTTSKTTTPSPATSITTKTSPTTTTTPTPKVCTKPKKTSNGSFAPDKEDYKIGDNITYKCDEGFAVSTPSNRTCIDGEWTEHIPDCYSIELPYNATCRDGGQSDQCKTVGAICKDTPSVCECGDINTIYIRSNDSCQTKNDPTVEITGQSTTTISMTITKGNEPDTSVSISYSDENTKTSNFTNGMTSVTIEGLLTQHCYNFNITTFLADAKPSGTILIPACTSPANIIELKVETKFPTFVVVSWKWASDCSRNVNFTVQHGMESTLPLTVQSYNDGTLVCTAAITNLEPSTTYEVKLAAMANTVTGHPEVVNFTTGLEEPQFCNFTDRSSSGMSLLWTKGRGQYNQFRIFEAADQVEKDSVTVTNQTEYQKYVKGLTPATFYNFGIKSFSSSPLTISTKFCNVTTCTLPSVPGQARIVKHSSHSLEATWTSNNPDVVYEVTANNPNETRRDYTFHATEGTLVNLTAGTQYTVAITAVFNCGNTELLKSNGSVSVMANTKPLPPPEEGLFSNVTETGFIVNWTENTNTSFDHYSLDLSQMDTTVYDNITVEKGTTSQLFENLPSGIQFTVDIYTVFGGLRSETATHLHTYTVPIHDPLSIIQPDQSDLRSDGFNITWRNFNESFTSWHVIITADENIIVNKALDKQTYTFWNQIGLSSGTKYNLAVFTWVPNLRSKDSTVSTIYTRPSDVLSASIVPANVHKNNFTLSVQTKDNNFTEYIISVSPKPSTWNCGATCEKRKNGTAIVITDLDPATNYTLQISTYLAAGNLKSLNAYLIWSYTGPVPPSGATVKHVDTTTISLEMHHDSTVFDTYQVHVGDNKIDKFSADITFINITGLTAGTYYNFTIYTVLANITSDEFHIVSVNTKPDPVTDITLVMDLLTNSSMTVTWSPPVIGHADLYTTVFTCTSPNVNSDMQRRHAYNVSETNAKATGLDPGTLCNVQITSQLNGYNGEPLDKLVKNSTKEEAPGNVLSKHLEAQTTKSIGITWTRPSFRNGIIRVYTLTVKNGNCTKTPVLTCTNDAELTETNEEDTNGVGSITLHACFNQISKPFIIGQETFDCSISGLHPYRNYSVTVSASTTKTGPGETSDVQTLEDLPGMPLNLKRSKKTHNEISLQWLPPVERNGRIINYTITYKYNTHSCTGGHGGTGSDKQLDTTTKTTLGPSTSYTINAHIYPYWDYTISVSANTKIGPGEESLTTHVVTDEYIPGNISDDSVTVHNTTFESATFQWDKPCYTNGVLTSYNICIENLNKQDINNSSFCHATNDTKVSLSLTSGILPYRQYHVTVGAATTIGSGYNTSGRQFNTTTSKPTKPQHISENNQTATTILVAWSRLEPDTFTGPTKYIATATDAVNSSLIYSCTTSLGTWIDNLSTNCTVYKLDEYWNYNISVQVLTKNGDNWYIENSSMTVAKTIEAKPGPVQNITLKPETDATKPRSIKVTWEKPTERDLNGILKNYYIQYLTNIWQVKSDSLSYFVKHIKAGNYNVSVYASTSAGNGTKRFKTVTVHSGAPIKLSETGSFRLVQRSSGSVSNSEKQISVLLPLSKFLCNNSNGEPTRWGVVVSEANEANDASFVGTKEVFETKIKDVYKSWFDEKDSDSIHPYVATPKSWNPCPKGHRRKRSIDENLNFKVGESGECSGKSQSDYCNGQLAPGRSYKAKAFVCTTGGCTETKYSEPINTAKDPILPIGLGAGAAAFVIIVVVVVVIFMKRRQAACFAKDSEQGNTHRPGQSMTEMRETQAAKATRRANGFLTGPVALAEFPTYVERLHKDSGLLFADAYKMLRDESPKLPTTAAEAQNCRPKNRYTNILPFDHSRVKLLPFDDEEGSDYINANYVPGYTSKREYIATQGPMIPTKDDFWRMVWEQNVDTIVMLTKLMEKGRHKCDQYWPELNEPLYYGDLVVSTQSESNLSDYSIRIIEVKLKNERRKVSQFCYLKWPDMGCPDNAALLLDFVKAIRKHSITGHGPSSDPGPIIVHCSAGVGRTGTFIAVDHLLQHIRDHDDVDIYKLVLEMRHQRCNMVQTEDQYVYIHECLRDFITMDEDEDEDDEDLNEPVYENTPPRDNTYENLAYSKE